MRKEQFMDPQEEEASTTLTPAQQAMSDLWDKHMRSEFESQSVEDTLETMVDDPYVNHVPVLTGGVGLEEVRKFYSEHFIPKQPPDAEIIPVSRTVGNDRVVDELIDRFTHTIEMDWMLPGIPPTGRRVEVAVVVRRAVSGGEDSLGAYLLGPRFGAGPGRSYRPRRTARKRCRECPEGSRSGLCAV
jgi:carboxymethylenebutenolidase